MSHPRGIPVWRPNPITKGYIQNISSGGMLIESRDSMPVGQQLTLFFMQPKSRGFIKISGQVVRTVPEDLGVQFDAHVDGVLN